MMLTEKIINLLDSLQKNLNGSSNQLAYAYAVSDYSLDCKSSCYGSCDGDCSGGCSYSCQGSCDDSCSGSCHNGIM